jgi:hypothetical protein
MKSAARHGSTVPCCVLYRLPAIAKALLGFSGGLFSKALCLLSLAADELACTFLNFSRDVFGGTFDLVFVHFSYSLWVINT